MSGLSSLVTQAQRPQAVEMKHMDAPIKHDKLEVEDVAIVQVSSTSYDGKRRYSSASFSLSFLQPFLCCFAPRSGALKQQKLQIACEIRRSAELPKKTEAEPQPISTKTTRHKTKTKRTKSGSPTTSTTPATPTSLRALLPPKSDSKKKTLVLDLDETLVHSSFKPVKDADFIVQVEIEKTIHNVYVCKRPGVDDFLIEMSKHFEIVVFTASVAKYADPVLDYLDPSRVVTGRLFREACTYMQGNYVKDLSRLGRDLSQTLIIDNSPCCYALQPNHAMPIISWFDDPTDAQLFEITPWLQRIAASSEVVAPLNEFRRRTS